MVAPRTESGRVTYGFVAKATLVVIGIWALSQALWMARDVVFIAFAAVLLAMLFSLGVDRLEEVMPRGLAAATVVVAFLALLFGVGYLGWPALEGQVSIIREEVPRMLGSGIEWVRTQYEAVMPAAAGQAPPEAAPETVPGRWPGQGIGSELAGLASGALPLLNTAVGTLTGIVVVIFAGVFLVIDPQTYVDGALRLAPQGVRERLRTALHETGSTLKRWIAGMSMSMVVIFGASTLGLTLLGVPAPVALGLIAGILVFIPFIGPILSAIPAMTLAFTVSPILAVWVALLYTGIQLLESNFLTPLVMREAVDLEPAVTILFQIAMGVLFGFLGLFLAVPLLAASQVLVRRLYVEPLEDRTVESG
jgi:predicted PurR-regulated permease PerM